VIVGDGPLDVVRAAQKVLDPAAELCELEDVAVVEAQPVLVGGRNRTAHGLCAHPVGPAVLGADRPVGDALVGDQPGVRGDPAGDDALTQTPRGFDAGGAPGEQHTRDVGVDQALHQHGRRDRSVVLTVPLLAPVGDGTVGPERGPAPAYRLHHLSRPADAEDGVVLSRRGGLVAVLGGRRGPHGDVPEAGRGGDTAQPCSDLLDQRRSEHRLLDQQPCAVGALSGSTGDVDASEALLVGPGRHHEPGRHGHSSPDQSGQRCRLSTGCPGHGVCQVDQHRSPTPAAPLDLMAVPAEGSPSTAARRAGGSCR